MVDADIVGTDESTTEQTRHWLVNSASLSTEAAPYAVNWTGSTSMYAVLANHTCHSPCSFFDTSTDYAGPGPASGSGSHRYVSHPFIPLLILKLRMNAELTHEPLFSIDTSSSSTRSPIPSLLPPTFLKPVPLSVRCLSLATCLKVVWET